MFDTYEVIAPCNGAQVQFCMCDVPINKIQPTIFLLLQESSHATLLVIFIFPAQG